MLVYGYINEQTRSVIYRTYYGDKSEDFDTALEKCRKVKAAYEDQFAKFDVVCFLTTTMKVE